MIGLKEILLLSLFTYAGAAKKSRKNSFPTGEVGSPEEHEQGGRRPPAPKHEHKQLRGFEFLQESPLQMFYGGVNQDFNEIQATC